jgi:DNA gyrase subunit A
MKFRDGDELLAMDVLRDWYENSALFVVTEGGFAKRTSVSEYRVQGRGGLGIKVANLVEARGDLVGALLTGPDDEVMVIMESGKIVRSAVGEVNLTGRNTQGVTFARPDKGDRIIAVARNVQRDVDAEVGVEGTPATGETAASGDTAVTGSTPEDAGGVASSPEEAAGATDGGDA